VKWLLAKQAIKPANYRNVFETLIKRSIIVNYTTALREIIDPHP
jgi:hypothetical protein